MPITLSPDTAQKLKASTRRYAAEHLEGVCHQAEFTYWLPPGKRKD